VRVSLSALLGESMPEEFDPYYTWLGIPPDEQPANHYRLLGVRLFEENPDVIENGADQRMTHLRTFQTGKRAKHSQDILNQVAAAKVCLLNPKRKAAYDEHLREEMGEQAPGQDSPPGKKLLQAQPLGAEDAVSTASDSFDPTAVFGAGPRIPVDTPAEAEKPKLKVRIDPIRALAAGGGLAVVLLLVLIVWSFSSGSSDKDLGELIFQWPEEERERAVLHIDDEEVSVPPTGEFIYPCSPGTHQILAARPGFQDINSNVDITAEGSETIEIRFTPRAMLVLKWGKNEDRRSPVEIDGEVQEMGNIVAGTTDTQVELIVAPGDHIIRISRPGFEPFEQAFTIAGREPVTVAPVWKQSIPETRPPTLEPPLAQPPVVQPPFVQPPSAQPPEVQPPEAQPPVVQPPPAVAKRLPVPSQADQASVSKEIDEVYGVADAKDPADQIKLAVQMLDLGRESGGNPAEQFSVLRKAAELASEGGDAELMLKAINIIGEKYEIDTLAVKSSLMRTFAKNATNEPKIRSLAATVSPLVDQAVAEHRYGEAYEMINAAYYACMRPSGREFRKDVYRQRSEITGMYEEWKSFKESLDSLKTAPNDPAANLAVGRWYCFTEGNWDEGLPALAKSNDPKLQSLAQKDRAGPADNTAQVALGDEWWSLSEGEEETSRNRMMQRAAHWYRQALPQVQSVLARSKINQRLERVAKLTAPGSPSEPGGDTSAPTEPDGTPPGKPLPKGEWVDALKAVDVARNKDGVRGPWTRDGEDIKTSRASPSYSTDSLCMLPVQVEGNYDMQMEFTRTSGDNTVFMVLPVGIQQVAVALSYRHGEACGLNLIGGRAANANPSTVKPGMLKNGKKYLVQATVQLQRNIANIRVSVDGKRLFQWKGLQSLCGVASSSRIRDLHRPGLGACDSEVTFHSAKIRVTAGEGHFVPSGPGKLPFSFVKGTGYGTGANFIDLAPEGGRLAGFRIAGDNSITHIQPLYRVGKGPLVPGEFYGSLVSTARVPGGFGPRSGPTIPKFKADTAKAGYSVGGLTAKAASYRVYGMRTVYVCDGEKKPGAEDRYNGQWLGGYPGEGSSAETVTVNAGDRPIIGIYGSYASSLGSIGFLVAEPAKAESPAKADEPSTDSRPRRPIRPGGPPPRRGGVHRPPDARPPQGRPPGMDEKTREERKAKLRDLLRRNQQGGRQDGQQGQQGGSD